MRPESILERNKSVPSPFTQTTTLCEEGNESGSWLNMYISKLVQVSDIELPVKAMISLLLTSGMRVSEMLNIHSRDVDSNYRVYVKGCKGSNDRLVHIVYFKEFWNSFKSCNYRLLDIYDRFFIYRTMKKLGFSIKFGNNSKASVTHTPRYLYLKSIDGKRISIEGIAGHIGHKRVSNSKLYINK